MKKNEDRDDPGMELDKPQDDVESEEGYPNACDSQSASEMHEAKSAFDEAVLNNVAVNVGHLFPWEPINWPHWLSLPLLTKEQAACLLHGIDPRRWEEVKAHHKYTAYKDTIKEVQETLEAASARSQDNLDPKGWLKWHRAQGKEAFYFYAKELDELRKCREPDPRHEASLQRQLESIADESKRQKQKKITKEVAVNELAKRLEMDPQTLARRTRKTW